ncbi:hypothetical protein BWQ96_06882 [Gracilariopsis chorda]|uniref:AB hydrolase-1 domain-containing protein n=1 Tax=Gracilariopsis chorda TaxID=448386 RepID=A0A2V3IMV1_9FLOR|nr:hypothetical protein BWQ96_06882 [Gracilariopsis chorda]|eukprot:PXF43387.1 hypothetical protein BWQ96_06882 [Gracilariopsis chorda]
MFRYPTAITPHTIQWHLTAPLSSPPAFALPLLTPAVLATVAAGVEAIARRSEHRQPAGQLVAVRNGGRRVHVVYHAPPELVDAPCVVMEAGANSWSPVWEDVSRHVGQVARVFRYDRAGFGFSDAVKHPKERSISSIAKDLQMALSTVGANPPYVLVAHSLGALYTNVLVKLLKPSDVCGLVYVDAASPQTVTMLEDIVPKQTPPEWLARSLGYLGLLRVLAPLALRPYTLAFQGSLKKAATSTWARGDWLMAYTAEWAAALRESKQASEGLLHFPPGWLGETPIQVLVPDVYERTSGKAYISLLQSDVASYSAESALIGIKDCGHFVQIEKPHIVARAVSEVIQRAKEKRLIYSDCSG